VKTVSWRIPTARCHPRTEVSADCAARWKTEKRGRSADRTTTGRAPDRRVLQIPCACPSIRRQDRCAWQARCRTRSGLQHRYELPQRAGVESGFHFNAESAGQKHCQFTAAAASTGNLYRDKPLGVVWFVALGLLSSIASQIAPQRLEGQIPLLTPALCTISDPPNVARGGRPFGDPENPALKQVE
jgi:hypothetical protein